MSGRAARVVVLACALAWSECFPVVGSRQGVAPSVHLCVAPYRSLPAERLRGGGGQDAGAGGGQAQTSPGEEAALDSCSAAVHGAVACAACAACAA